MTMIFEWAQYDFMRTGFLLVIMFAPLLAFIGCVVINNSMAFFSDSIGHSALAGIALGAVIAPGYADTSVILFVIGFTIAVVTIRKYSAASTDTILGLMTSFSVALGLVLLSRQGGLNRYTGYLVGDILSVTWIDLLGPLALWVVVAIIWLFFFNRILLTSVNSALAKGRGINPWAMETLFSLVVAVAVALGIRWMGLLVINAFLIIPAASSRNLARSTSQYVLFSILIGLLCGPIGLVCSYYWSVATGPCIVLFMAVFFALTLVRKIRD